MAAVVISTVPIVYFGLLETEIHAFRLMKTAYFLGGISVACVGTFLVFQSWVVMLVAVNAGVFYTNSTLRCLAVVRSAHAYLCSVRVVMCGVLIVIGRDKT